MTLRLYYEDVYRTEFDATVLHTIQGMGGTTGLILDRTCFYPTSGGQPCDSGTLDDQPVREVVEEGKEIIHWITGKLRGTAVRGKIDWPRRFDHMQQHTGQHILSQAFLKVTEAQTVSFHLGEESSTIDLDCANLDVATAHAVEDLANEIVFEDRLVIARFVDAEELHKLELRKAPSVERGIRIVEIEGFDRSPCGGTHCSHCGEVGPIAIRKWERRGQETRLEFVCGWRAVRDYRWKTAAINELALAFSIKDRELKATVMRLMQEAADSRRELQRAKAELLEAEASRLLAEAISWNDVRVVTHAFGERDAQEVRGLALLLAKGQRTIALLGTGGKQARLFFARTEDVAMDMSALLKKTCFAFGGSGGGQPHLAQGGGLSADQLDAALEWAYKALTGGTESGS